MSKPNFLGAHIIDHMVRKDGLFRIFEKLQAYEACLAAELAKGTDSSI